MIMSASSAGLALLGFCGLSALGESAPVSVAHAPAVPRWAVFEVTMALSPQASRSFDETGGGPAGSTNPFEIPVVARFAPAAGGDARTVAGFYDGGGIFKARFSPPIEGNWTWSIESSFDPLDSLTGTVTVRPATVGSPGCPKTSAGKLGFAYPDGTSYNPVGTTCYAWVHQPEGDPLEEATLASLKASPFNKVRMTGFPKWYPFTHHEPRYYPFMGNFSAGNSSWDFTRPNPIFWQHFESRVQDVVALGIVPEIILFHPYDNGHWGFNAINKVCGKAGTPSASHCGNATADCLWCDENYIKYMVARVSAYGTWWSMANEWDLEHSKTVADWDQLFQTLQAADAAHDRERSIHNCMKYYNHSQPWVSHVSLQGHSVQQIDMAKAVWTSVTPKPIVQDEVEYEGNITYGWGALSGYTESKRAWTALTNQVAMAGHSNTDLPAADDAACSPDPNNVSCNAIMWWNKGDILRGESPARLGWYRKYVAGSLGVDVPVLDDTHSARIGGGENNGTYMLYSATGDWRIVFWRNNTEPVEVDLGQAGGHDPTHVDWWGMQLTPVAGPPLTGKVTLKPPAGADSILQLVRRKSAPIHATGTPVERAAAPARP